MIPGLSFLAYAAGETATPVESGQSGPKSLSFAAAASRAEAFGASCFTPRKLLLSIDFENETVEPVRGQENRFTMLDFADRAIVPVPGGMLSACGRIQIETSLAGLSAGLVGSSTVGARKSSLFSG